MLLVSKTSSLFVFFKVMSRYEGQFCGSTLPDRYGKPVFFGEEQVTNCASPENQRSITIQSQAITGKRQTRHSHEMAKAHDNANVKKRGLRPCEQRYIEARTAARNSPSFSF